MTHDNSRGFLCGKEQEEEDARKEAERQARQERWDDAHDHAPDAPPAEWADDEIVEQVVNDAELRGWVWACAKKGSDDEDAYVEELGKKLAELEKAADPRDFDDVKSAETEKGRVVEPLKGYVADEHSKPAVRRTELFETTDLGGF